MKLSAGWAVELAESLLAEAVPRRWVHTRHAVGRARTLTPLLGEDAELLVAAVALHDIGYSPALGLEPVAPQGAAPGAAPGFPLFDAVRYLESVGAPRRLVCLVANHCGARIEGPMRGYPQIETYADEGGLVRDALWFSCLSVGPDGEDIGFAERIAEWSIRYSDDPLMGIFTEQARPILAEAFDRVAAAAGRVGLVVAG